MDSGDYDDPDDYPDLAERLEAYKSQWDINDHYSVYREGNGSKSDCVVLVILTDVYTP